jgi:hypothetical protein
MNKQFYYIPLPLEGLLFETLMAGEILLPSQHFHQLKIGFLGENTNFPFGIPNAISLFTTLGNDLAKNSTDGGHLFVLQVDAGVLVESCLQEIGNGKAYSYHAPILLRPNTCNILFYTQSDLLFIKSQAVSFSQVKCLQKYEHCFRLIDDAVQLPEFEIMLAPKKIAKGSQKNGQPVAKKAKEEVENRLAGAAIHRLNHLKGALLGLVVAVTKIGSESLVDLSEEIQNLFNSISSARSMGKSDLALADTQEEITLFVSRAKELSHRIFESFPYLGNQWEVAASAIGRIGKQGAYSLKVWADLLKTMEVDLGVDIVRELHKKLPRGAFPEVSKDSIDRLISHLERYESSHNTNDLDASIEVLTSMKEWMREEMLRRIPPKSNPCKGIGGEMLTPRITKFGLHPHGEDFTVDEMEDFDVVLKHILATRSDSPDLEFVEFFDGLDAIVDQFSEAGRKSYLVMRQWVSTGVPKKPSGLDSIMVQNLYCFLNEHEQFPRLNAMLDAFRIKSSWMCMAFFGAYWGFSNLPRSFSLSFLEYGLPFHQAQFDTIIERIWNEYWFMKSHQGFRK